MQGNKRYQSRTHESIEGYYEKVKESKNLKNELNNFLCDIEKYLNSDNKFKTSQDIAGFKFLFRKYIIKDFFRNNEEYTVFFEFNKIIVKYSVEYYLKYWEQRNEQI